MKELKEYELEQVSGGLQSVGVSEKVADILGEKLDGKAVNNHVVFSLALREDDGLEATLAVTTLG